MTPIICLSLFLIASQVDAIQLDVNGIATGSHSSSLNDVEMFVQEEVQVLTTLSDLDAQLTNALDQLSSASGSAEIDVEVGESDLVIHNEMVVVVPTGSRLSDQLKNEIKQEIEAEVAGDLDAMIVEKALESPAKSSSFDRVQRLFEEEAEAEKELEQMKDALKVKLENLPDNRETEIDVVVTESDDDNEVEVVEEEIVVIIPASTQRLSEQEKEQLEEEIVGEAANAMKNVLLKEFLDGAELFESVAPVISTKSGVQLQDDPRLEENSPQEHTWMQHTSEPDEAHPKPVFRSAAIAQPGFEHPMFVPRHWQMPPDEQLWTLKLSMLSSISCLTLLLIVGVWTGVRRSRRRAVIDDSHFRWAEAVEYMDAFPYEP